MQVLYAILKEMGFKNISEFFITAFGLCYKKVLLLSSLVLSCTGFVMAQIDQWVNKILYSPSMTLYTLLGVIVLDWMSATLPAIAKKEFETNKAKRIFPVAITHVLLLMAIFHGETTVIAPSAKDAYHLFRLALTNYIFFVYLISAVTNAGRHGYINTKIVRFLTDYVDRNKQQKS